MLVLTNNYTVKMKVGCVQSRSVSTAYRADLSLAVIASLLVNCQLTARIIHFLIGGTKPMRNIKLVDY